MVKGITKAAALKQLGLVRSNASVLKLIGSRLN